jgi:hypothetical protein
MISYLMLSFLIVGIIVIPPSTIFIWLHDRKIDREIERKRKEKLESDFERLNRIGMQFEKSLKKLRR